jgi:hypothetical protein
LPRASAPNSDASSRIRPSSIRTIRSANGSVRGSCRTPALLPSHDHCRIAETITICYCSLPLS